jgi:DNA-3-methyladenine glycosylase II
LQEAIQHLRNCDQVLAAIIERVGPFRLRDGAPTFETLARSIVFQQLNGRAALTIWNRLAEKAGSPVTPEAILKLRMPTLRKIGLSQQKASYIRDLAKRTASGELNFVALPSLKDEEVIATLTRVKGIGEWTAHMFLIFALRRLNILPTGDYGVRAAMKKAYRMRDLPSPKRMQKIAKAWHPYCSVASWYLWRSLDVVTPAAANGEDKPATEPLLIESA